MDTPSTAEMASSSEAAPGAVPVVDRPPVAKHDSTILDLAFAMDCTGSMGSYIHQAQQVNLLYFYSICAICMMTFSSVPQNK